MALLAKGTHPGLATPEPPNNARIGSGVAAEDLAACDACRFGTDGRVFRSIAAADDANAVVDGFVMKDATAGETVTLYSNVNVGYGKGSLVVPGTNYFLSAAQAGGLDTTAGFSGARPIARGVPDNSLFNREHKLRVTRSIGG